VERLDIWYTIWGQGAGNLDEESRGGGIVLSSICVSWEQGSGDAWYTL